MGEIRAFVGHSFAEEDETIVASFLDYFRTLEKSHLNFSWTNAAWAEPIELTAKVLRLMSDKDTFIGICTKQQRSIAPNELKQTYAPRGFLKARAEKFQWKASDWIIQEIGLAVGKGFRIILLVENGLQRPGALQGNIEYIDFDRGNPDACFPKILQMLITLSPRAPDQGAPLADPRSPEEDQKTPTEKSVEDNWWKPTPDWTQTSYDIVATELIRMGDSAKLEQLNEEYRKSSFITGSDNAARWDAFIAYNQLAVGTSGSIANLKKIAADNPESARVQELLALGLAHVGEQGEAARVLESAVEKAPTPQIRARLLGKSALAFSRARHEDDSLRLITQMRVEVEAAPDVEVELLHALTQIAKSKNDDKITIPLLERTVELFPDDYGARFDLAFAHSANGNDALALFHYLKIPEHERGGATWNNLGVSSDQKDLPGHAVEAYRKAENDNNTLAMSNLASKFVKAGFLTEALAQCEKALGLEDPDKNVGLTWARVKSAPEDERKRVEKILAEAAPLSDFYRQVGHAAARRQSGFAGAWKAPECDVAASIKGNDFTAEGAYEVRGLASLVAALGGTSTLSEPQKYRISYRGVLNGRTVHGTVERGPVGEKSPKGTILGGSNLPEVFMALSDDGKELKVMETPSNGAARFYSLVRDGQASEAHTQGG